MTKACSASKRRREPDGSQYRATIHQLSSRGKRLALKFPPMRVKAKTACEGSLSEPRSFLQLLLNRLCDFFAFRFIFARKTGDDLSGAIDKKLVKIP